MLLLPSVVRLAAQTEFSYRGTEFFVAFMPSDRITGETGGLFLYLVSDADASCIVHATDRDGVVTSTQVLLRADAPNNTAIVELPHHQYELLGAFPRPIPLSNVERPTPCHVRIESDVPIAVYASSRVLHSTDAWMVFPTAVLGTSHYVMSYESDSDILGPGVLTAFPSQFVVIATEDNTDVDIALSTPHSLAANGNRRSVTLNRGECYMVQARVSKVVKGADLSGTLVRSSKRVALIGGHFRAAVPRAVATNSRDFLAEQIPAVDKWGSRFAIPPLPAPTEVQYVSPSDRPLLRIMASVDGTVVLINGVKQMPLKAGQVFHSSHDEARLIESTEPILVALLDRSSSNTSQGGLIRSGDPSLIIVPPIEQYLSSYTVFSIEPKETQPVFTEHWLVVSASLDAFGSVTIDGTPVAVTGTIPNTDLAYAHVSVSSGAHVVNADQPVGLIAVGFGPAESYGYTGGMSFKTLRKPTVFLTITDVSGLIDDDDAFAIVVDSIENSSDLLALSVDSLAIDLEWDGAVFVPRVDSDVAISLSQFGFLPVTIGVAFKPDTKSGDTLAVVRGTYMLGKSTSSSIVAFGIRWSRKLEPVFVPTVIDSGSIVVTGICRDGQTRLFDYAGTARAPIVRLEDNKLTVLRSAIVRIDEVDYLGRTCLIWSGYANQGTTIPLPGAPKTPRTFIVYKSDYVYIIRN